MDGQILSGCRSSRFDWCQWDYVDLLQLQPWPEAES